MRVNTLDNNFERRVGAVMSLVTTIVNAALTLLYVPLLLLFLSGSEYGVYELIGSFIGYMSILDLGFSTTLTRYCVRERTKGDKAERNLLAVAAIVYAVITVIAVGIGIGINCLLDGMLSSGLTASELTLAHQMMVLVIINTAVILPGNYFLAVVNSHERFIFSRLLLLCRYVLQFFGVVSFLMLGTGATGAVLAQVVANASTVLISIVYCCKCLSIRPRLYCFDASLVKELFSYSCLILLGLIFNQVFLKTGQVILGAVAGSFVVGVYSLSCKIVSLYIQVANAVSTVYLPKLTQLCISPINKDKEINAIFFKVGKIQSILVWGVFCAFVVLGSDFIFLWAGPKYGQVYPLAIILMLGFSIDLVQNLGIQLLQARNRLLFRSIVLSIVCILIVFLGVIGAPMYGAYACAVTTGVAMFIATGPIMNVYYAKIENIWIASFWKELIPEIVCQACVALISICVFSSFTSISASIFLLKAVIFLAIFVLAHCIFYHRKAAGLFSHLKLRKS